MPFINTYNSCDIVSEIYNNKFYKTYAYKIYACGNNNYGHLGIGSRNEVVCIPQKVLIEEKIKDIKIHIRTYNNQTYFITINDEIYACGHNLYGYLGVGSNNPFICIPQKVLIEEKIKDIKIRHYATYFITINDEVYACGNNYYGQFGIGSRNEVVCIPHKVLIEEKIKYIKLDWYNTYFITFNNEFYQAGQIGSGSFIHFICIPEKYKKMFF